MGKDYLKGFSNLGVFIGVQNTAGGYQAPAVRQAIEGAVNCSKTDNRTTTAIPADDDPEWDVDVELTGAELTTTVRHMPLPLLAALLGATISADGTLEEGDRDQAPECALNFRAPKKDGGYRGFRYYCCKLVDHSYTLNTRGSGTQEPTAQLKWRCSPRAVDGVLRGKADFSDAAAVDAWLLTIPAAGAASDVPSAGYFTVIAQVEELPAEPALNTLYILTAEVKVGTATYAAGDSVYWDGTAWKGYTVQ